MINKDDLAILYMYYNKIVVVSKKSPLVYCRKGTNTYDLYKYNNGGFDSMIDDVKSIHYNATVLVCLTTDGFLYIINKFTGEILDKIVGISSSFKGNVHCESITFIAGYETYTDKIKLVIISNKTPNILNKVDVLTYKTSSTNYYKSLHAMDVDYNGFKVLKDGSIEYIQDYFSKNNYLYKKTGRGYEIVFKMNNKWYQRVCDALGLNMSTAKELRRKPNLEGFT